MQGGTATRKCAIIFEDHGSTKKHSNFMYDLKKTVKLIKFMLSISSAYGLDGYINFIEGRAGA